MSVNKSMKKALIGIIVIIVIICSICIPFVNKPNESEDYPRVTYIK